MLAGAACVAATITHGATGWRPARRLILTGLPRKLGVSVSGCDQPLRCAGCDAYGHARPAADVVVILCDWSACMSAVYALHQEMNASL